MYSVNILSLPVCFKQFASIHSIASCGEPLKMKSHLEYSKTTQDLQFSIDTKKKQKISGEKSPNALN